MQLTRVTLSPIAVALLLAAACSGSTSRALVPVDISAGTVAGIKTVDVTVFEVPGDTELKKQTFDWTAAAGMPLKVGLYLRDGFSGSIAVRAWANDGTGKPIGSSQRATGTATKGERSAIITLNLVPDTSGGDAGAGTGGAGGTAGGSGGSGGSTGGTGGGTGGTGGATGGTGGGGTDGPDAGGDVSGDVPPVISATWMPGEDIEKDPLAPSAWPDVAIDDAGNVLVVWREGSVIRVRRYNGATRTWDAVKTLDDRGPSGVVQVAMAGRHALATWHLSTSEAPMGTRGMWMSYSANGGVDWSPRIHIHDGPVYYEHYVAIAANGFGRVVWQESANNLNTLWTAHHDPAGAGLGGVAMVRMGDDVNERYPRLAIDNAGTGLITWIQDDPTGNDSVWGASFTGATLATPQLLDSYTTDNVSYPDVHIAATGGRGMAVWQQRNGTDSADLYAADWVAGEGWKPPARVLNASWVSAPAVVVDRAGNATVAFTQPITGYKWNVIGTRRPAGGSWAAPQPLETANQAPGRTDEDPYADLGVDTAGNVHAVWRRKTSATANVFIAVARRYSAAAGTWEPEVVLGQIPMLRVSDPELAVGDDGRAVAAFYFQDPAQTANLSSFNVFVALYR